LSVSLFCLTLLSARLDRANDKKNYDCEQRTQSGDSNTSETNADTNRSRHPHSGSRRQPSDLVFLTDLEDRAGSDEANSRNDPLNDSG